MTDAASDAAEPAGPGLGAMADLAGKLADEAASTQAEIDEIELLINQARTEAARHESRRSAAADKLASMAGSNKELADVATTLVSVARKAALMEAQVDLLEGKRKSMARMRDVLKSHADQMGAVLRTLSASGGASLASDSGSDVFAGFGSDTRTLEALGEFNDGDSVPPAVARIVLSAQEDLRREIARAMHDGPAQSLTNIVLQAQIVERLLAKDAAAAVTEVHALTAMVQRTLDATKTFIFDVRPMVLDDLGLVPTLRRASRDRGARARVKVDFESIGVDRRLPVELESGLFRMLDDALAAHVAGKPERLALHLDWSDKLVVELTAGRATATVESPDLPPEGSEMPPALAAMVEDRRAAYHAEVEAARVQSLARLPDRVWREISERSALLGIDAQLLDEGARLRLIVALPGGS
ncbi:MAG TPA: histidine kinase [Candidatus Acidoferrales bacterium]|nr:histidine kinase [Candidatus Acidoferrales bacterium]